MVLIEFLNEGRSRNGTRDLLVFIYLTALWQSGILSTLPLPSSLLIPCPRSGRDGSPPSSHPKSDANCLSLCASLTQPHHADREQILFINESRRNGCSLPPSSSFPRLRRQQGHPRLGTQGTEIRPISIPHVDDTILVMRQQLPHKLSLLHQEM